MKKQATLILVGIIAFIALVVLVSSAFIVNEVEHAIVTKFGRPSRVIAGESSFTDKEQVRKEIEQYNEENQNTVSLDFGAGLYFKIPFIENVEYFDDRILLYDSDVASITTRDKKRIVIDNFARWRIANPLQFRIRLQSEKLAQSQLDDIIYSVIRGQLGEYDFIEIIRSTNNILEDTQSMIPQQKLYSIEHGRVKIMEKVTELCREAADDYGIQILDVRIKRADLPEGNLKAVYENMTAERERIATKYIEEGKRDSEYIRAETDRQVKTLIAEAERDAQIIRGSADAEAARMYAKGFIKEVTGAESQKVSGFEDEPEFFQFVRSLEALEESLTSQTQLILDTHNELLQILDKPIPSKQSVPDQQPVPSINN